MYRKCTRVRCIVYLNLSSTPYLPPCQSHQVLTLCLSKHRHLLPSFTLTPRFIRYNKSKPLNLQKRLDFSTFLYNPFPLLHTQTSRLFSTSLPFDTPFPHSTWASLRHHLCQASSTHYGEGKKKSCMCVYKLESEIKLGVSTNRDSIYEVIMMTTL